MFLIVNTITIMCVKVFLHRTLLTKKKIVIDKSKTFAQGLGYSVYSDRDR